MQTLRHLSLSESDRLPTSGAALADYDAQSMASGESQVGPFIDGRAEHASDAFEGRQQVHGARAEAGEHGPNLSEEENSRELL